MWLANSGNYKELRWFTSWKQKDHLDDILLPNEISEALSHKTVPFGYGYIQFLDTYSTNPNLRLTILVRTNGFVGERARTSLGSSFRFPSFICSAADYKFPDPILEFADAETQKFRTHLLKKLSKKDMFVETVGICTEVTVYFLRTSLHVFKEVELAQIRAPTYEWHLNSANSDYELPNFDVLRKMSAVHRATKEQVAKYEKAIQVMRDLDTSDPQDPHCFTLQANFHCAYCNGAHDQVGFNDLDLQISKGYDDSLDSNVEPNLEPSIESPAWTLISRAQVKDPDSWNLPIRVQLFNLKIL
ncbi:putative polyphenol oxidase [Forsythia ovata]|uniref:Polyphenol oxidase n=1 Tax=Forsythia ovata TaxID=205694 RepID=A0ABD1WMN2_9LAMI